MTLTEFVTLCGQAEKLYDTTCSCDGCPLEKCEEVIEFDYYPCSLPKLLRQYAVEVPELCAVDLPGGTGGAGSADARQAAGVGSMVLLSDDQPACFGQWSGNILMDGRCRICAYSWRCEQERVRREK